MASGAGEHAPKDYVGASKDPELAKTLLSFRQDPRNVDALAGFPSTEEEKVLFADNMIKINRFGSRQQRTLIITSIAVLNFKPKKYKEFQRRIPIAYIEELWIVAGSADLVMHMWEVSNEYDYRFDAGSATKRQEIVDALVYAVRELLDKDLAVREIDEKTAKSGMILKTQIKEKSAKAPDAVTTTALASRRSVVTSVSLAKASSRRALVAESSSSNTSPGFPRASMMPRASTVSGRDVAGGSPGAALLDVSSLAESVPTEESVGQIGIDDVSIVPSLKEVASDIKAVSSANPENEVLAKAVADCSGYEALSCAILYAEALLNANAADPVISTVLSGESKAGVYLHGAADGVVYPDDADTRAWSTRVLWRLLSILKSASLLQDEIRSVGGFDGFLLRGFELVPAVTGFLARKTYPVTSLEAPVSRAIMEVLVDGITKPSDNATAVETFGKLLARPEHLRLLLRMLPTADWQVKHDILKDLNVLLIKREDNFPRILDQSDWIGWLAPLLASLPRRPADRTDLMNEYLKYVINFFTMLLAYTFQGQGADIERQLSRFISQLTLQCGWGDAAINVARNIMASVLSKIAQSVKRWNRKYDRSEWDSLFKLATFVEDFIFYRPVVDEAADILAEQGSGGVAMMVYIPESLLNPSTPLTIVGNAIETADRSNPGLHLNIQTGEADDLKLAQRMVSLMEEVGLTGDPAKDPNVASARDKKSKDMLIHANTIMKVFTEIVSFLEDCNKSRLLSDTSAEGPQQANAAAETKLIENLAKFLEKRQKQQRTGFMSKSANKKGIVQALQTSVMRQRAQQTIRTQVQATIIAKATVTTVMDVEEDLSASPAKAGGLAVTARRLQGTRAAVEQVTGSQAPSAAATSSLSHGGAGSIAESSGTQSLTGHKVAAAASEAVKASLSSISVGMEEESGTRSEAESGAPSAEDDTRVADIICDRCGQPLLDDDGVSAMEQNFHVNCFCCYACDSPFRDAPFFERKGKPYCRNDYLKLFGKGVCAGCMCPLQRGEVATQAAGRMYHQHHFFCEGCGVLLPPEAQFYERDNAPYCASCNLCLFGTCAGCNKQVTPDRPAVSALNRNWHLSCIKCANCKCSFPDGVFYTHEDTNSVMQAYCERDYLELFAPRCRACNEPVKDDGMAACSACWHAACFVCTTCKCSFPDGAYFEVDGRPYCSKDYYGNFGTKCAGCNDYILEELVNAIGKTWHAEHFVCAHCSKPFPDMEYYEKDGKAYDEPCYCELFCPVCPVCNKHVVEEGAIALDNTYHPACLVCSHCGDQLTTTVRKAGDGKLYCEKDFLALCAYNCGKCNLPIEGDSLSALEKHWHVECFTCFGEGCSINLAEGDAFFHEVDGLPYCNEHFGELKGEKCCKCGKGIFPSDQLTVMGRPWHPRCLTCGVCNKVLTTSDKIYPKNDAPHCEPCYMSTAEKCVTCDAPILGKFLTVLGRKYHATGCLGCVACAKAFEPGEKMYQREGWPVCIDHARGDLSDEAKARIAKYPANPPPS